MRNNNKYKYFVTVNVDLFDNSTETKFDAFSKRLCGTNIKPAGIYPIGDHRVAYAYKTSDAGLPIVLKRWNDRLGSGMDAAQVTVELV